MKYSERRMSRRDRWVPMIVLILLWAVQAIRVTHGVDFNDEMQYYGELVGLLTSGRLFSNDLFIQQGVYVLVYPIFKPYVSWFGAASLILAARVVFALFVLWVFRRVRRALEAAGTPAAIASLAALSCTFIVPAFNIYAISYNTVGLGLLSAAFAEHIGWRAQGRRVDIPFWTCALLVTFVAYPPLAAAMGAVLVARLAVDRDAETLGRLGVWLVVGGVGLAAALYAVIVPADLQASLQFSRAVSVGRVVSGGFVWVLAAIPLAAAVLLASTRKAAPAFVSRLNRRAVVGLSAAMAAAGVGCAWFEFPALRWIAALYCAFAGLAVTAWPGPRQAPARAWTTAMFVAAGLAMCIASSNGLAQIHGPALLGATFYVALAMTAPVAAPALRTIGGWTLGGGLLAFAAIYWLGNPYHDAPWWQSHARVIGVPAFAHLWTSPEKASAILEARRILSDIPARSRVMVVGAEPWIYFATDTQPDTDMVFMHEFGGPAAAEVLAARLAARRPEYVVVAAEVSDAVRRGVDRLLSEGAYACDARPIGPALTDAMAQLQTFYDLAPVITVCHR